MEAVGVLFIYTIVGMLHALVLGVNFADKTMVMQLMDAAITIVIYSFFSRNY